MRQPTIDAPWRPRENFPSLRDAPMISFDVETRDPRLDTHGPGAIRKDGYVCGFSVGTPDGFAGYYPLRHEGGNNLANPGNAIRWLRDQLETDVPKVGANLLYDVIWARCDLGIEVGGKLYDVQVAEPLLDENRQTFRLEALARDYLGEGKVEDLLYRAGIEILKVKPGKIKDEAAENDLAKMIELEKEDVVKQVKKRLWELPARYVGPYGEGDAILPIKIFEKQKQILIERDLWNLFDGIETELLRVLVKMWLRGVPVDVARGERTRDELKKRQDLCLRKIKRRTGLAIDIWSADDCVRACETLGLKYPFTDKENPSFKAEWLADQDHDFFKLLLEARQLDRCGSVFIEEKILNMEVDGRIHPQFWQVKTDRRGSIGGRIQSSNPNAQQFPARNEELAKKTRSILVAEPGAEWGCFDWSQQEPRLTIHYAALRKIRGAEEAARRYVEDPSTDYHQMTADLTSLARKIAKSVNLGLTYGMGPKKFSEKYGFTYGEARSIYDTYHEGMPFVKELSWECERAVKAKGYIKTILGRHCHFDLWGPPKWSAGIRPLKKDAALKAFGNNIVLYFLYRAINRLVQGSAADMVKKSLVDLYRAGYLPCLTVHDENDFCDITSPRQVAEITDIMLHGIKLLVPLKLDVELGPSWGELEEAF